jgi:hypothetical protein
MNDIFQVDYLPNEKKIKINLPEEVWRNIAPGIILTLIKMMALKGNSTLVLKRWSGLKIRLMKWQKNGRNESTFCGSMILRSRPGGRFLFGVPSFGGV